MSYIISNLINKSNTRLLSLGKTGTGWYVYIIKASDGLLYTGITVDITRRWSEHSQVAKSGKQNTGKAKNAKFFRGRRPDSLLFLIQSASRSTATKEELAIKSLTRKKKIELIKSTINQLDNFPELTELQS